MPSMEASLPRLVYNQFCTKTVVSGWIFQLKVVTLHMEKGIMGTVLLIILTGQ